MRWRSRIGIAAVLFCVSVSAWAAPAQATINLPRCKDAAGVLSPYDSTAMFVWDRATTLDAPDTYVVAWERRDVNSGNLIEAGDEDSPPTITAPTGSSTVAYNYTWTNDDVCSHTATTTYSTDVGLDPVMQFGAKSNKSSSFALGVVNIAPKDAYCLSTRALRGTMIVGVRGGKTKRRAMNDICSIDPVTYKMWSISKGLDVDFNRDDYSAWMSVTVDGPAKGRFFVEFRGGQTYHQRQWFSVTRIDRPDRKIWAGTDEYWNYCVNDAQTVYAENGNYYCWKLGLDEVHISKASHG